MVKNCILFWSLLFNMSYQSHCCSEDQSELNYNANFEEKDGTCTTIYLTGIGSIVMEKTLGWQPENS